jgi:CDP-paratose 2-epimerase
MKILITGICGFVGATLARDLLESLPGIEISGLDNLIRAGAHLNRTDLLARGIRVGHGDVRLASDWETLPAVDWVIDAAANPSVLAGVDGLTSSRQLLEHNLGGTLNALEFCKRHRAGFLLLSTSRVYSVSALAALPMRTAGEAFELDEAKPLPVGVSGAGLAEDFSTAPPLSLYGNSKLCSEWLALEYGAAFNFPVWINRCGVLAGAGQFGRADQGIFSFWIHSWRARRPLKYIGFAGTGCQVRDALHPRDLTPLLAAQMRAPARPGPRILNLGGGRANAMSLAELSAWCAGRFGAHAVDCDGGVRAYDIPWLVMDAALASEQWHWQPRIKLPEMLEEIAAHAEAHPHWLDLVAR